MKFRREGNRLVSVTEPEELHRLADSAAQTQDLAKLWRRAVGASTGRVVPVLTMKQLGMLTRLAKRCEGFPEAARVILVTVQDWAGFRERAEVEAGAKVAAMPQVAALLQHVEVALNMPCGQGGESEEVRQSTRVDREPVAYDPRRMTDEEREAYNRRLREG